MCASALAMSDDDQTSLLSSAQQPKSKRLFLSPTVICAFVLFVCLSLFVVLYTDESYNNVESYKWVKVQVSEVGNLLKSAINTSSSSNTEVKKTTNLLGCKIRKMDPWDPQILPYDKPNWKPSCTKKQAQITDLVNRTITVNKIHDNYYCWGRCLRNIHDWAIVKDSWENVTSFEADCDIVETQCGFDSNATLDYNYLHTQIVEREDDTNYWTHSENLTDVPGRETSSDTDKPNIYIMVFDSTSTPEFVRSMSRTLYLMKEQHEATIFQHVNKLGINSRPNAWTLMFGKQVYSLGRNPYTESIDPDLTSKYSCKSSNDNENYWMHRFRDVGYHTMMADDWAAGAINWPDCTGFKRPPAKHYMRPYQRRTEEKAATLIRSTVKKLCHETYEDTSLYLEQFMNAYKNQSELAFIWNSELAHNVPYGLYHADDRFYRMLKSQEARLNNSFVIIMGDHGLRFGGIRKTKVGELEDNNPLLMVSVPVKYRQSNLVKVIKQNALKLITHYDTYASLMHLAELAKDNRFDDLLDPESEIYKAGHGSSYFRSTMNEPRDCGTLRIPYEFCLCEKKWEEPLNPLSKEAKLLANYALKQFEGMIEAENATSLCHKLTIQPEATVAERFVTKNLEFYSVKITVLPSEGIFTGYVEVVRKNGKMDVKMLTKRFARQNKYDSQGDCVKELEDLRPVCYCKNYKKS